MLAASHVSSYAICFGTVPHDRQTFVLKAIDSIIKSVDWDHRELQIATRRVCDDRDIKVLIEDPISRTLMGYAIILRLHNKTWYIAQFAVAKSYQRQGIGHVMMHKIFEEAVKNHISKISLDADEGDSDQIRFYRSFAPRVAALIEDARPVVATNYIVYVLAES